MRLIRAQSLSEYSISVVVIILAVIMMQSYLRRGIQGRYADLVDQTTARVSASSQYEPYYLDEDYVVGQLKDIESNIQGGGKQRIDISQDQTTRSGTSIKGIGCYDDE